MWSSMPPDSGSVFSLETKGITLVTTKVPWPGRVSTSPRETRSLMASRTVFRDVFPSGPCPRPYSSLSSTSLFSCAPGGSLPDSIWRRRSSAISRYMGSLIRPPQRGYQQLAPTLAVTAVRQQARNAAGGVRAQLRVPGHDGQIQLGFDSLELKLHAPELRADSGGNLLAKIDDTQGATEEHAQQGAQEEDQHFMPFAAAAVPSLSREACRSSALNSCY